MRCIGSPRFSRRHHDEAAARRPSQLGMRIVGAHRGLQRVDCGIAGDIDALRLSALAQKILPRELGGGEIVPGNDADRLAVEFLGIRRIDIVGAQSCLDVPDRDLQIEAGKCGDKGGGGIAVHQHNVGLDLFQHGTDALENVDRDVKERLPILHDREIIIRHDIERAKHSVQHLAVLSRDADHRPDSGAFFQLVDERAHFDCFGSRPEDQHNCFHWIPPRAFFSIIRNMPQKVNLGGQKVRPKADFSFYFPIYFPARADARARRRKMTHASERLMLSFGR